MNEYFLNYDQALALKKLGFDERCFMFYHYKNKDAKVPYQFENTGNNSDLLYHSISSESCTRPLRSQALKFFRDKYNLHHRISREKHLNRTDIRYYPLVKHDLKKEIVLDFCENYEDAESAAIDQLIIMAKDYNI